MTSERVHEGGCFCGDVRYAASGPSVWSAIRYCETCTKTSGGIAVARAGIEKARFRRLKGNLRMFESTPGIWRGFCPRCGASLTYQKDPAVATGARDDIYIATRTLDDPSAYPPEEHVFYGERVPWLDVNDDRPHHEGVSRKYGHLQYLTLTGRRWAEGEIDSDPAILPALRADAPRPPARPGVSGPGIGP